jgi:ribonuclease HI
MAWAFLAVDEATGEVLERQLGAVPPPTIKGQRRATNFIAEYGAILKALEWLVTQGNPPATIYASLQTALSRIQGSYPPDDSSVTERTLAKVLARAAGLRLQWAWVPTPQNPANPLAHAAYRHAAGHAPTDWAARRKGDAA